MSIGNLLQKGRRIPKKTLQAILNPAQMKTFESMTQMGGMVFLGGGAAGFIAEQPAIEWAEEAVEAKEVEVKDVKNVKDVKRIERKKEEGSK